MTITLETLGQARIKAARRQRVGVINRYLGWFILPLVIAAVSIHYSPGGLQGTKHDWVIGLQVVFVPLVFLHLAMSLYVFGLVRPARTLRVFHIYFGYVTFVLVMVSQTTFGNEPLHTSLTVLMYLAIALHITIGLRYGVTRHNTEVPRPGFTVDGAR